MRIGFILAPLTLAVVILSGTSPVAAAITLLHEFAGGADDGENPQETLLVVGGKFFSTTFHGGDSIDFGTLFSINPDGTDFTLVHEFGSFQFPSGDLAAIGSRFFGGTSYGQVYSVNSDGSAFTVLHGFPRFPNVRVTAVGGKVYGTASSSTQSSDTVFVINPDGTNPTVLHTFTGGAADGAQPAAGLTSDGAKLFGTTFYGGDANIGVVYSLNTDGSDFTVLHKFAGGSDDGSRPTAIPLIVGSTLFGTTSLGGDLNKGTVYSINVDGTGYSVLHEFLGGGDDGAQPDAELILVGSRLFGTTRSGGDMERGTIFSINTDGSGFKLWHEFLGDGNDGRLPVGALTQFGANLFGTTRGGGDWDEGTVFILAIPEPAAGSLAGIGVGIAVLMIAVRRLQSVWRGGAVRRHFALDGGRRLDNLRVRRRDARGQARLSTGAINIERPGHIDRSGHFCWSSHLSRPCAAPCRGLRRGVEFASGRKRESRPTSTVGGAAKGKCQRHRYVWGHWFGIDWTDRGLFRLTRRHEIGCLEPRGRQTERSVKVGSCQASRV